MAASPAIKPANQVKARVFRLFISYAREDEKIAIAVFNALQSALGPSAEVFIDSGLPYGLNFEEEIFQKLDETDTLVVIDSNTLKPAFGFTGVEVGYFLNLMAKDADRDFGRRIIPIYSEKPPDILTYHQGIKIGISHNTLAWGLEEYEVSLQNLDYNDPTVTFLREFQGSVDDLHEKHFGNRIQQSPEQRDLPSLVKKMQMAIFSHLKTTPESTLRPQKQITIRTNDTALKAADGGLPDDALLIPVGNGKPLSIFDIDSVETTWGEFQEKTQKARFRDSWVDAITSVVTSSNKLEIDNSQVIVSHDEAHTYRVILTTETKYYDGVRESNLYFVEYLKRREWGDCDTTLLLKGLELFCRFRSMFLEKKSEFSSFSCKMAKTLKTFARDMERELNLLHKDAMELGLDEARALADFVDLNRIQRMVEGWRPLEDRMRELLCQIRHAGAEVEDHREAMVAVLRELENTMGPLNADAVSEMADKLKRPAPAKVEDH